MNFFKNLSVEKKLSIFRIFVLFTVYVFSLILNIFLICDGSKKPLNILFWCLVLILIIVIAIVFHLYSKKVIITPIKKLTEIAECLAIGDLDVKIEHSASKDEIDQLFKAFLKIKDNISEQTDIAQKITNGDLSVKLEVKSDKDILSKNLNEMITIIKTLINETSIITQNIQKGNLSFRGREENFNGGWNKILNNINNSINAFVVPIKLTAEYVDKISKGNIPPKITENFFGDFNDIKNSLNTCIYSINALVADINMLTRAGLIGMLDVRADVAVHGGEFANIIDGINQTLNSIIEPVNELSEVLKELSKGNLSARVKGNWSGFYAETKENFNSSMKIISSYVEEISSVLQEMSSGNIVVNINGDFKGDFVQIKDSLNQIIEFLNQVFGEINFAAEQFAFGAGQVSDSSQILSKGTNEQALAIEEMTVSMNEIAGKTKQNAINADAASELAVTSKNNAVECHMKMQEMLKAIEDIHISSQNISKVINVIDEIAFQTNILALNAAVEAARAGQHGRGFAVVAEEVRNLAERSAEAVNDTTLLIENSVNRVSIGKKIADATSEALNVIVDISAKTSSIIEMIAAASNEQATAIDQVNLFLKQISQVVQTNSLTSEETAATSEELAQQSELLEQMVRKFKVRKTKEKKW